MIEWREITRDDDEAYNTGVASFLQGYGRPSAIGGELKTDYALIRYSTLGVGHFEGLAGYIDSYNLIMEEETGQECYLVQREEPDLRIIDLLLKTDAPEEGTYAYLRECLGCDGLRLATDDIIPRGEIDPIWGKSSREICWCCRGLLSYPVDLESLTVGNWSRKTEEVFKTSVEGFLDSLRDARNLRAIYNICSEHFSDVIDMYHGVPVETLLGQLT